MPIIKSAIKRAKQSLVRRSRNLQVKRAVKQDIQALHTAITAGQPATIEDKLSAAYSEIDRAVKKGALHKNTAARRKSQLAGHVAKVVGTTPDADTKKATTKGTGKAAAKKAATTTKKAPATAKKAPATKAKPAATKKTTKTSDK